MPVNKFAIARDFGGNNTLIRPAPEWVDARVLAAGVAEAHTVPSDATVVIFSSTAAFYCKPNGTAAAPSTDVLDGSGSELNPTSYNLRPIAGTKINTLSLVSTPGATVTMAFYA